MEKSAVENLIEAIKGSQAEYPSVMMTKKHWLEVVEALEKDNDGPVYLEDKEQLFEDMKIAGIEPTEHETPARF